MPKIQSTPPLDALASSWAERARRLYHAGDTDAALDAARKAIAAAERFGDGDDANVTACRRLIEQDANDRF